MSQIKRLLSYITVFVLGILIAPIFLIYGSQTKFQIGDSGINISHWRLNSNPHYILADNPIGLIDTLPHRNFISMETFPDSGKIFINGDTIENIRLIFKSQIHIYRRLDSAETILRQVYNNGYHSKVTKSLKNQKYKL